MGTVIICRLVSNVIWFIVRNNIIIVVVVVVIIIIIIVMSTIHFVVFVVVSATVTSILVVTVLMSDHRHQLYSSPHCISQTHCWILKGRPIVIYTEMPTGNNLQGTTLGLDDD